LFNESTLPERWGLVSDYQKFSFGFQSRLQVKGCELKICPDRRTARPESGQSRLLDKLTTPDHWLLLTIYRYCLPPHGWDGGVGLGGGVGLAGGLSSTFGKFKLFS
jgi:hypothetical protein